MLPTIDYIVHYIVHIYRYYLYYIVHPVFFYAFNYVQMDQIYFLMWSMGVWTWLWTHGKSDFMKMFRKRYSLVAYGKLALTIGA
jgi:hypothetical protein